MCGGFPCQPFSLAGVYKKLSLGRKHGFEDEKQGNLFFSIAEILDYHKPDAFVLENVKHLVRHDQGRTFKIISDTLKEALGYQVYPQIIDARSVVPQHRERIFLVEFKQRRHFDFPVFPEEGPKLSSILEPDPDPKYTLAIIFGTTFRITRRNTRKLEMGSVSDFFPARMWREHSAPAITKMGLRY